MRLISPSGQTAAVQYGTKGRIDVMLGQTEVLVYAGQPSPYSVRQEIFFDMLAVDEFVEAGIWKVSMRPKKIVSGAVQMYLPGAESRSADTRFVRPDAELTLTHPVYGAESHYSGGNEALL